MSKLETETVEQIKATLANEANDVVKKEPEVKIEPEVKEEGKQEPSAPNPESRRENLASRLGKAYDELNDTERKAWQQGWRKEEFFAGKRRDGTPRKWINAEEFLERTKEALPVANERIKELTKKVDEAHLKASQAEQMILEAEERGYKKALEEIQKKQENAVELGDIEEFKQLKTKEMDIINNKINLEIKEEAKTEIKEKNNIPQQPEVKLSLEDQKTLTDWVGVNDWYLKPENKLIADYARGLEQQLLIDKPYLNLEERLEVIDVDLNSNSSFSAKIRPISSNKFDLGDGDVNNSIFGQKTQPKGYNDLPKDIKASCEKLIRLRGITGDSIKNFRTTYTKIFLENNN